MTTITVNLQNLDGSKPEGTLTFTLEEWRLGDPDIVPSSMNVSIVDGVSSVEVPPGEVRANVQVGCVTKSFPLVVPDEGTHDLFDLLGSQAPEFEHALWASLLARVEALEAAEAGGVDLSGFATVETVNEVANRVTTLENQPASGGGSAQVVVDVDTLTVSDMNFGNPVAGGTVILNAFATDKTVSIQLVDTGDAGFRLRDGAIIMGLPAATNKVVQHVFTNMQGPDTIATTILSGQGEWNINVLSPADPGEGEWAIDIVNVTYVISSEYGEGEWAPSDNPNQPGTHKWVQKQ
ncbi:hypothetical protein [Corynebacterium sp. H113]|uniref:hypothetical protein n=1 Tax=Corynebacterium sp. H113 TaxID=3133419 RepID=UPI0030B22384